MGAEALPWSVCVQRVLGQGKGLWDGGSAEGCGDQHWLGRGGILGSRRQVPGQTCDEEGICVHDTGHLPWLRAWGPEHTCEQACAAA